MQFILNRLAAVPCKHIFCHFTFSLQYKSRRFLFAPASLSSCLLLVLPL